MSVFNNFTNIYSLSKTLRFELKPVGNTGQMLIDNKVFQIDENRKKAYENTKPYFDKLHREFIAESFENAKLEGLNEYFDIYKEYKKDKKNNEIIKQIDNKKKSFREQVLKYFNEKGNEWATQKYSHLKIKKKDLNILFEEEVFQILKDRYGNEQDTKLENKNTQEISSIFDNWNGFTGYFKKFFETRRNFYKSDGTSTAIATRIVDHNLDRFLDNLIIFNSIKSKLDLSEVEDFFQLKADHVFSVDFYNSCFLQSGIDKYNEFIGGKTLKNGEKKKGVNEIINKYRQDNKDQKIPFLKKLDRQILSEEQDVTEEIESDDQFFGLLGKYFTSSVKKVEQIRQLLDKFFKNSENHNLAGVFISKESFNTISHKWTSETELFSTNLYEILKTKKIISSSAKKKDGTFSFPDFISLADIKASLTQISLEKRFWKDRYYDDNILTTEASVWDQFLTIFYYEFDSLFEQKVISSENKEKIIGFNIFKKDFEKLLQDFKLDKDAKITIKNYADSVLHIYQMAKYFALEKKRVWITEYDEQLDGFYTDPEKGYLEFYENAYEEIVQVYNKIRNYLTKKPYSEDKWKLNFENSTLAQGWDKNKERDNSAVILRKDDNYYLAVMRKGANYLFLDKNTYSSTNGENYEKLVYKLFPDPLKMMPRVCFSKKGLKFFKPSEEIYSIYKKSEFKKGDTFSIASMQKLIQFYIDCLAVYPGWKYYDFTEVKKAEDYTDNIGEFFNDVAKTGYKIWFENISEDYIREKNESGELFLFQIYNKDFSEKSTGTKNLHTLYFKELFSQNNIEHNFPFKLNGEAELFYRPKSLEKESQKRNFKRDVVNKRRYTENKIFFHVPITLNRTPKGIYRINEAINNFLADNKNINIIGVDRGEKNLIYYSVINQKGELLRDNHGVRVSGSLNDINRTNYHKLLEDKARRREQARKDWQDIEGIKDLKRGYISQVVRKLADLAIEHNAIIVMEDLNMRFKQIRGGIEKSVYQQLEKALIEKFNFLANKYETDPEKAGHLLKAYQLTAPFATFKDMGKQTGIIFYTQASYTSKIDPVTGWRPNLYLKYSSAEKAKEDILKFKDIKFTNDRFELTYDIQDFLNLKEYPNKTTWTVCSNVERFRWDRKLNNNKGGYIHYKNLTDHLTDLFLEFKIDVNKEIKQQIAEIQPRGNEKLFRDFIYYFGLICQIRNTHSDKEGNENDFIQSPVAPFFDSRRASDFGNNLPENGDENGAYNIARKGIIILNKISKFKRENKSIEKIKWEDFYISHQDWDNFATQTQL